ncbi:hypothetical protein [Antiquaquibacter soli]|uniref:Gram-positive cocci surface proteins LPxTG domain-containing protein n=1 Tax=Antiquaquibacter soli TaxID=3064523 RepID=A0ABT9BIT3_9MICO|nr:hypothetical protein [Protaetiibacter sp. WY-16]MDO7880938.1 hypothetical protein [Protaetiibacter sp. WY-16]
MTRIPVLACLGAAAVVALGAAPASAADVTLYTYGTSSAPEMAFATLSTTDAALEFLATNIGYLGLEVTGTEVCGGAGIAFAEPGEPGAPVIATWNTSTGEVTAQSSLWMDPESLPEPSDEATVLGALEADSLSDCSPLTIVTYRVEDDPETITAIASVDPGSGETTVIVDVPSTAVALATNPISGQVTLLLTDDSGAAAYAAPVDLAAKTVGAPVELTGLGTLGGPIVQGVDVDESGTTWMIVATTEAMLVVSFAPGAALTSTPTIVGDLPITGSPVDGPTVFEPVPLAVSGGSGGGLPAPVPQLAATGAELPLGVALGAGILLLLGLVLTRRRAA